MSNVLARDRGLSSLTFYSHLMKTRELMTNFLADPKKFKARDFYTYCSPILRTMIDVTQNVIVANSIYPINEHEVMIRRDFQNIAIGLVESAIVELTIMITKFNLSIDKGNKMREIIDALRDEVKYLKWWRKQNNSLMKKFRELESQGKIQTNPYGIEAALAKLGAEPVPFVPVENKPKIFIPEFKPMYSFGEPGREKREGVVEPIYSLADYPPVYQHGYNIEVAQVVESKPDIKVNDIRQQTKSETDKSVTDSKSSNKNSRNVKRRIKVDNFFDRQPSSNLVVAQG